MLVLNSHIIIASESNSWSYSHILLYIFTGICNSNSLYLACGFTGIIKSTIGTAWQSQPVTPPTLANLVTESDRLQWSSVFTDSSVTGNACSSLCSKIQSKLSSPAGPVWGCVPGSRAAEPGVQVSKTSILANSLSVSPTLTRHFDSDVECDVM